jgi:NNP family nitrate/nitrite transporter-like MFS transporter
LIAKECPVPESFNTMIGNIIFLTIIFFLSFISRFIFAPLMPALSQNLGITPGQAGSIFLVGSVGVFIGALSSGFVSSRINHRGTLILSLFGVGIALLACILLASLWTIRVCMILLGIAAGLQLPSNIATITAIVGKEDWGKALAVQQTAPPLSLILGPLLSVVLLAWFSWRIPLAIIGGLALIVGFGLMRFGKLGDFPGDRPNISLAKQILTQKAFWIMVILFSLGIGGQVGIYAMLPLYLVNERGLDQDLANTLIGLSQISALFMTFLAGWITDRLGEKRAIAIFLTASGLGAILLGIAPGSWLKGVIFIQPALAVCFFPAGFAALSRIVQPNLRSLVSAWAAPTAFILGGGIFPTMLGYMGQVYSFGTGISITGLIIILGSRLTTFLKLIDQLEEGC